MAPYVIVSIILTVLASVFLYIHRCFKYWESRGIPFITPRFPFGNVGAPFYDRTGIAVHVKNIYDQLKQRGVDYGGFYAGTTPVLLAVNPDFIKTILVKEFKHFSSQGTGVDEQIDPISANIFHMDGQQWKDMRTKLNPTFTTGKLKQMFEVMIDCANQFSKHIDTTCNKPVVIREILEHFTLNASMACLLGLDHTDIENSNAEFLTASKTAMATSPRLIGRHLLSIIAPSLIKLFRFKLFSDVTTMPFVKLITDMIEMRKGNKIIGNDIVQVLMDSKEKKFTAEEITAEAFAFFIGGFETSNITLTYCLYELARHHDIQHRIRQEIEEVTENTNGKLTYDGVMQMKYLDQVIKETLRMYPVGHIHRRACTEDFTLPNKTILKKGTSVFVSTIGLHRDKEYFEDPDDFQPDRFSEENRSKIHPFTYLPFGGGPRICIGSRFATLALRVGLASVIKDYQIDPHESLQYPMEFDNNSFMLLPRNDVVLNLKRFK